MKRIFIALVDFYKWCISPLLAGLGCRCRFHPSCSDYAIDAFERHDFCRALWLSAARVLRCGPWHPGGVDLVR